MRPDYIVTVKYPCGCQATGPENIPGYCPRHAAALVSVEAERIADHIAALTDENAALKADRDQARLELGQALTWRERTDAYRRRLEQADRRADALRTERDKCLRAWELRERETQGWQPIETAPLEERIIVGGPDWVGEVMAGSKDEWRKWQYPPTHWMPLPAPPAQPASGTAETIQLARRQP